MTIVEALKKVVTAFGGTSSAKTVSGALQDVTTAMGGTPSDGNSISGAIDAVADAVSDLPSEPTGKISITANGNDIDVSSYATADVNVPNPSTGKITITENGTDIDVSTYATADVAVSGGSSDFSTAEVGVTNNSGGVVKIEAPMVDTEENSTIVEMNIPPSDSVTVPIVLYQGLAFGGVANGEEYSYTFTGGIEGESGELVITGNGTILIEAGTT